jgi:tRNA pseudouridine55 synthase
MMTLRRTASVTPLPTHPTTAGMTGAEASVEGVLPIDKPAGPTSHDMVARARRALGTRRVGHTGTLDPFASGLLLLCIGRATRIAEYLSGMDKRYTAIVRLGVDTDTEDATGTVITEQDANSVTRSDVESALHAQRGRILQTPPAYSAKKVGGERSYRLAREGRAVDLEPVSVSIHHLEITYCAAPDVHLDITCSSGTYIRAIARDLGAALGVGAHLTALRRTAVGSHSVADAISADDLEAMVHAHSAAHRAAAATDVIASAFDALRSGLITTLDALGTMPRIDLSADDAALVRHGRTVTRDDAVDGILRLVAGGELIAIAHAEGGRIRPRKVFL